MIAATSDSRRIGGGERTSAPRLTVDTLAQQLQALRVELSDLRKEIASLKNDRTVDAFQRKQAKEVAETSMIQRFGTREELTEITERVQLNDAAQELDARGVRLVAQVSYMTGWIPFLDFHAFKHKGKVCIMPDYKRLVQDSDPGNLSWSFRVMSDQERKDRLIDKMDDPDQIVGVVCELVEISKAKELAAAGLSHLYRPVLGYGVIDLSKDRTIAHRDPMKRGEIRALRDALNQTAKGQQAQDHFRSMLRDASKTAQLPEPIYDDEADGYTLPDGEAIEGDFTETDAPAPEPATTGQTPDTPAQQAALFEPPQCAKKGCDKPADTNSPYPTLCKEHAKAEANAIDL
jgi:hypothetical protein